LDGLQCQLGFPDTDFVAELDFFQMNLVAVDIRAGARIQIADVALTDGFEDHGMAAGDRLIA
jgi:hypothetical protein